KRDNAAACPKYAAAFKEQGLDVLAGDEAALVQRVQDSPLRDHQLTALDDWLVEEPDAVTRKRLCQLTAKITGHAWRQELPELWDDAEGLEALLDRVPPQEMPVVLLVGLCRRLEK